MELAYRVYRLAWPGLRSIQLACRHLFTQITSDIGVNNLSESMRPLCSRQLVVNTEPLADPREAPAKMPLE